MPSLDALSNLQTLTLSDNHLSGTLPSLGALTSIIFLCAEYLYHFFFPFIFVLLLNSASVTFPTT